MYPTIPYTGRHRIQLHYVRRNGHVCAASRAPHIPSILCALLLMLTIAFTFSQPACAANLATANSTDTTDVIAVTNPNAATDPTPQPTIQKTSTTAVKTTATLPTTSATTDDKTYVYIDCPIMSYKGTAYENEPIECLVDDFEDLPERWLYVLAPLEAGESYFFTLDLACRTMNAPFEGQITAVYNSCVPDDGSLGSVTIEATEQIGPNTFLVYRGELKYISDGTINLVPNSYGSVYDHHLFYFSLATADSDFTEGTEPLGEQRLSRISGPSVSADVAIIGVAKCADNVYDNDLLQSDYMYPYRKYEPAEGSAPGSTDVSANADSPSDSTANSAPPAGADNASAPPAIEPDATIIFGGNLLPHSLL